jgi:hypothetical protein
LGFLWEDSLKRPHLFPVWPANLPTEISNFRFLWEISIHKALLTLLEQEIIPIEKAIFGFLWEIHHLTLKKGAEK